jgi:hypothetical protein
VVFAVVLAERLFLAVIACLVVGHYASSVIAAMLGGARVAPNITVEELVSCV